MRNKLKKYTIIEPDLTLQNNLMVFGFECDTGWHYMINELLDKIQDIVNKNPAYKDLRVVQIKEKFGGLRCYMNYEIEEVSNLIEEYENLSYKVCEACGNTGELRDIGHWYSTLCKDCYEEKG